MGDGRISVIDVASRKVVQTIDAGARGPNRLKFTPDGKLALVSEIGGGGLIVLDVGTRTVKKRVPLGRGASGILIPPEGGRAYVALTGSNVIAVIDLESLAEVARYRTGSGPDGMAWLAGETRSEATGGDGSRGRTVSGEWSVKTGRRPSVRAAGEDAQATSRLGRSLAIPSSPISAMEIPSPG